MANGQGEGQWEARRDRLWREAHEMQGLGRQFWAEVDIDPNMNPMDLTEPQVVRLAQELAFVGWMRLSPAQKYRQQRGWSRYLV